MKRLLGMQHPIILVVLFLTCSSRQLSQDINQEINCINLEPGQKGFIQLAKNDEPGEHLVVYGKDYGPERKSACQGCIPFSLSNRFRRNL